MILQKLNYIWRLFGTGLSFTLFGVGGVVIPLFAIPILLLIPGSRARRQQRSRWLVHQTFRVFIGFMKWMGVLRYQVSDGGNALRRSGQFILANHPTLLDIVFLVSLVPNANCIVKSRLMQNPAMRGFVWLTGYITNDRGAELVQAACDSLKDGNSLIVFPEGTRSIGDRLCPFQRGAAQIAIRSQIAPLPVLIDCDPPTLQKAMKWYQIPPRRFFMRFKVLSPLELEPYLPLNAGTAARRFTRDLESFFKIQLQGHVQGTDRKRHQNDDHHHAGAGRHSGV
jgi:1-acyl-sn-glycerol-3-phosphate acyltransferase